MKLCFDATRFGLSLEESIELASLKKMSALEFSFAPFTVSRKSDTNLGREEKAYLGRIRELSKQAGVEIACLNLDFCLTLQDQTEIKRFLSLVKKLAKVARALNCARLCFWLAPGFDKDWKAAAEQVLTAAVEAASAQEVKLLLRLSTPSSFRGESLSKWRPMSPQDWRDLLSETPGLALSFSAADCLWQKIDYLQILPGLVPAIEHVEALDVEINQQLLADSGLFGPLWWRYRLPGRGQIDWRQVVESLKLYGYAGNLSLHLDDEFIGEDDLANALDAGFNLFAPYVRD